MGRPTPSSGRTFTLSFSFDGRVGGIGFSTTDQALWNGGSHPKSANQFRYDEVVNGRKTFVGRGVKVISGSVDYDAYGRILRDDRVFAPNDRVVSYEAYVRSTTRQPIVLAGRTISISHLSS